MKCCVSMLCNINVVCAGKRGNIYASNNVSSFARDFRHVTTFLKGVIIIGQLYETN